MQLKTILNRVQKFKSFVYQEVRWADDGSGALVVAIAARAKSRPICSGCHRRAKWYDTLKKRLYEFVPLWGMVVFFEYARRRVDCVHCGVQAEKLP